MKSTPVCPQHFYCGAVLFICILFVLWSTTHTQIQRASTTAATSARRSGSSPPRPVIANPLSTLNAPRPAPCAPPFRPSPSSHGSMTAYIDSNTLRESGRQSLIPPHVQYAVVVSVIASTRRDTTSAVKLQCVANVPCWHGPYYKTPHQTTA